MQNLKIIIYDTVEECESLLNSLQERLGEPYGNYRTSSSLNKFGVILKTDKFENDFISILGETIYNNCPVITRDNLDWFSDVK